TEEEDETNPVEEQDVAAHLDSTRELLFTSEIKIEDGMNDFLKTEEEDETNPVEEQDVAAHLDSIRELLFTSEIKIEDGMNDFLKTEEEDETNPVEEQDVAAHLDSTRELLFTSEIKIEDGMNDFLKTEESEGTNPMEEQDFAAQPDSDRAFISFSETAGEDKIMSLTDTEDMGKTNPAGHVSAFPDSIQGKVCSLTKKILISTHVEIDDFLHAPICGEIAKNTFEFFDQNNLLSPQFETKLINTTMDYPEQPNCRLVRSKINECIFLMKNDTFDNNNQKNNPFKSVAVPLHNTQSIKKGETNNHSCTSDDFMNIRVPVVVGEYKIEICLEEYFVFDNGIAGVKDISNEIVLTNSRFVPNQFSQSLGNGTCTALKGNLFIEGFINQNIEYTALHTMSEVLAENESLLHSNQLCQNMVLELVVHMLQVQQIRVLRV
uniref:BC_2427 family protein n=1 Tax=Lysinibacillus sphaericus TaxID=1421 RepID=UPI001CC16201